MRDECENKNTLALPWRILGRGQTTANVYTIWFIDESHLNLRVEVPLMIKRMMLSSAVKRFSLNTELFLIRCSYEV